MNENIESVKRYNLWYGNTIDCGFLRPLYIASINQYLGSKVVKVLTGQRRVGKSYILRQTAMHLMQQGVSGNNIVFINRELTAFDFIENYKDLDNFIRLYRQELKPEGRIYIFIDEVQDIEGWERVVNSLSQDYTEDYELFITGSNSKMFSGELSTLLSGRYVEFHIFPLSYEEYASIHQLSVGKQSYMQYMADGGYPELVNFQSSDVKRNYISGLKPCIFGALASWLRCVCGQYQGQRGGFRSHQERPYSLCTSYLLAYRRTHYRARVCSVGTHCRQL